LPRMADNWDTIFLETCRMLHGSALPMSFWIDSFMQGKTESNYIDCRIRFKPLRCIKLPYKMTFLIAICNSSSLPVPMKDYLLR